MVIWAATLWTLFACWLLASFLGAPVALRRVAGGLLLAEFVAVGVWSYGSEACTQRPCGILAEVGRVAASVDIPVLAGALIVLVVARTAGGSASSRPSVSRRRASRG